MDSASLGKGAASEFVDLPDLERHFTGSDIFFFLICTVVGIDGLGTLATKGGAGFTWLIVCTVLFAVPSALLMAELGAAYTEEGGPYVWVRMAFGHLAAAVNNVMYWVTNPVWMGGTLVGVALSGITVFFTNDNSVTGLPMWVFGVIFVWSGVLFAVLSFRVGKWVATVGAYARFALLGFFVITIIAYGAKNGLHGITFASLTPNYSSFVALVPLILFGLVGFELPSAAGGEMTNPARDVPGAIAKSVVASTLLVALPILGILLVLPPGQATGLAGFPDAVKQALTVFGGHVTIGDYATSTLTGTGLILGWIMGLLIVIVVFTSGLTWIMGSDRALAVSCLDGAGPRALGKFSEKFGTPLRVNVLSGVVSTVVFVATQQITHGNAAKFFNVALALAISTTLMSYLFIFPAAWKLRRKHPDKRLPYRAPMLGLCTVLSMFAVLFCTVQTLFPGLGDGWFSTDYLPNDSWTPSEKSAYLFTEAVPLVLFIALGVTFWALGRKEADAAAQRETVSA